MATTNLPPLVFNKWKRQIIEGGEAIFKSQVVKLEAEGEQEAKLYEQIGRLKMELEWLKKKSALFD